MELSKNRLRVRVFKEEELVTLKLKVGGEGLVTLKLQVGGGGASDTQTVGRRRRG